MPSSGACPVNPESSPRAKATTKDCFSTVADQQTPKHLIPRCADCGKESLGAKVVTMMQGAAQGSPLMEVRFLCAICNGGLIFSIMSHALYPHYEIMPLAGGDHYRLRRLTRQQALDRTAKR